MNRLLRSTLALPLLLAPALILFQGCKQPAKPGPTRDGAGGAHPTTTTAQADGLMKARISCPHGTPDYRIEGQTVIVNCPD
jgi:hypothetical protein